MCISVCNFCVQLSLDLGFGIGNPKRRYVVGAQFWKETPWRDSSKRPPPRVVRQNMIWNKSQASSTLAHGDNVSADSVDVMRSQLPEPEVDVVTGQSHRRQQATEVQGLRGQLVREVCQKSSINESYYNLDKILS